MDLPSVPLDLATTFPLQSLDSPIERLIDEILSAILRLVVRPDGFQQALVSKKWLSLACAVQDKIHLASGRLMHGGDFLSQLSAFPGIKTLVLRPASLLLVADFLTRLADMCPELIGLHMVAMDELEHRKGFTQEGLAYLLEKCSKLEEIHLVCPPRVSIIPPCICNLARLKILHLQADVAHLPDSFSMLQSLRSLVIHMPNLNQLPPEFGNLTLLKLLRLNSCLASLPESFTRLTDLERLTVESSPTFQLPDSLSKLISLKELELLNCQELSAFPDSFGRLPALESLAVCGGGTAIDLPETFGQLQRLQSLRILNDADANIILPDSLSSLSSLTALDLDCSSLSQLPEDIGRLPQLRTFDLSSDTLSTLPDSLTLASTLTELHLSGLPLASLPEEFGQLTALKILDLQALVELTSLPESIGQLILLQELQISSCDELEQLPDSLCLLSSLQRLAVYGGSLTALPHAIGDGLKSLTELSLTDVPLAHFPSSFFHLSRLEKLSIQVHGGFRGVLPNGFDNLSSLRSLSLCGFPRPSALPSSLSSLAPKLTSLELRDWPELKELPESFGRFEVLEKLELNRLPALESLPRSLLGLPRLRVLTVCGCKNLCRISSANCSSPDSVGSSSGSSLEFAGAAVFPSLQSLHIEGAFETLRPAFDCLPSVTWLTLRNMSVLRSLPPSLAGWFNLRSLDISGVESLAALPETVGSLAALTSLDLENLKTLRELPESVGQLCKLRSITIQGCPRLRRLPDSFANLSSLRKVFLNGVGVSSLPEHFGRLPSLDLLNLWNLPNLRSLPDSLQELRRLRTLQVMSCAQLSRVPPALSNLPMLQCNFVSCPLIG